MMARLLHIIILILAANFAFAQQSELRKALTFYQYAHANGVTANETKSLLDSAKYYIDLAISLDTSSDDPRILLYKGFIYKDLYKVTEINDFNSKNRLIAIESFAEFLKDNPSDPNSDPARKSITFLVSKMYNQAVELLNTQSYQQAITAYDTYKKWRVYDKTKSNYEETDLSFQKVLAAVYQAIYEKDPNNNRDFLNRHREVYEKMLAKDSSNVSANYSLGVSYFNESVEMIKNTSLDEDIFKIIMVQEQSVELFTQALPYMLKSYELEPTRIETLKGLSQIYRALLDEEKQARYESELKAAQAEQNEEGGSK